VTRRVVRTKPTVREVEVEAVLQLKLEVASAHAVHVDVEDEPPQRTLRWKLTNRKKTSMANHHLKHMELNKLIPNNLLHPPFLGSLLNHNQLKITLPSP
jgi:hypothetical protein